MIDPVIHGAALVLGIFIGLFLGWLANHVIRRAIAAYNADRVIDEMCRGRRR